LQIAHKPHQFIEKNEEAL